MYFTFTSNEINFRLSTAIAYRYGHNQQMFNYVQITKRILDLESLYTHEELAYMCQSDNVGALHEAISAII